jgi:hypothetical protein
MTFRLASKVDDNHKDIVEGLRKNEGISVKSVATIKGFADILVGYKGKNFLYEIKDPSKSKSSRRLTKLEKEFSEKWCGGYKVVFTIEDILKDIEYED